jgi:peptidyl-prolyl cis-trans isomerase B (cyclophilin B)
MPPVRILRGLRLWSWVGLAVFLAGVRAEVDSTKPTPAPETSPRVAIDTALGRIVVDLRSDLAPRHVDQFLSLVREGFYDGTSFHRVIPGFLIQGGDPNSRDTTAANDGYGGLEERRLPPEFSAIAFDRGVVGMARDYRHDGASCQFFITLGRAEHLDRRYTAFGRVSRGLEVADRIAARKANAAAHPDTAITMKVVELATGDRDPNR